MLNLLFSKNHNYWYETYNSCQEIFDMCSVQELLGLLHFGIFITIHDRIIPKSTEKQQLLFMNVWRQINYFCRVAALFLCWF